MRKSIVYTATLASFLITGLASTEGQAWGFKNLAKNKTVICTRGACGSPIIPDKVLDVCFAETALTDTVKHHPNCTKAFHETHCTNEDGTATDDRDTYETECSSIEKLSPKKYPAPTPAAADEDAGDDAAAPAEEDPSESE